MNFKRFSVGTTNIFPIANSTAGGQLLTEYNLRSRESVNTNQSVKYMIGPSYVHSMDDYYVRIQQDDSNVKISSNTLEILPGRAVVNGHFVESLTPILIDLAAANASREKGEPALKGELSIGLKVMYSTIDTMSGSMLVENEENVYDGIQVVILPRNEFILPGSTKESTEDESVVTAHIKLADFIYLNGTIINIVQNTEKVKSLSADRIGDVDKLLSNVYVTKTGLNTQNHHYVFSSKCTSNNEIKDTWCPADESLMIWDAESKFEPHTKKPSYPSEANFGISSDGRIQLVVPHKQVDGAKDTNGVPLYIPPKYLSIPVADYGSESAGTVNAEYTKHIKQIRSELNNIYSTHGGKQRGYIDVLTERNQLPPIGSTWELGDYILVGNDSTLNSSASENIGVTVSTMYAVLPGTVTKIGVWQNSKGEIPSGVRIDYKESNEEPNTESSDIYNSYWAIGDSSVPYRGRVNIDYFQYRWIKDDGKSYKDFYFTVFSAGSRQYSDPIFVTGQVALAETEKVGGFYNVTESDLDAGYVYLDETGHLRLLDYTLLRSGTLAYQLGQNWDSGSGLTIESIQEALDDEVNLRVAFANLQHESWVQENVNDGARTDVIHVYVRLSEEDSEESQNLFIRGLDSRFNTSVYLHVTGTTNVPVEIYVLNCQKIRIDNNIPTNVHFTVIGSSLYYDAEVLDNLTAENITLWYTRYSESDPNLMVDGMTVKEVDAPVISTEISYWDDENPNDLHYKYALDSVTFGNDASIIGLGIVVRNDCTDNIELGSRIIVSKFQLLQGNGFTYPVTKLTKNLKLSGSFITAYHTTEGQDLGQGFIVYDSNVTVTTNKYDETSDINYASGTLSIYVKSEFVTNVIGLDENTSIDGWRTDEYHVISGGVVS